ncbi:MAG: FtsX-like permease family protein [Marinilabiliales bacterium]|nr:FtsX-like permease family protein [Marinilabiliales bacterium]
MNLPGLGSGETQFAVEGQAYAEDQGLPRGRYGQVGRRLLRRPGAPRDGGARVPPQRRRRRRSRDHRQRELRPEVPGRRLTAGPRGPGRRLVHHRALAHRRGRGPRRVHARRGEQQETDPAGLLRADPAERRPLHEHPGPRTCGTHDVLTAAVRDAVTSVSPDTPICFVNTLRGRIAENTWAYNVFGVLFMVFGGVALFLASVGLYAVMAFTVSRRTAEVGIRMALGAEARQVLRLVLRQGMVQILVGLVLGLGLAALLSRAARLLPVRRPVPPIPRSTPWSPWCSCRPGWRRRSCPRAAPPRWTR